jgi:serine/threonine-protein kinase
MQTGSPSPASSSGTSVTSVSGLVQALRCAGLLNSQQRKQVMSALYRRYREVRRLAEELVQRGWVTAYQAGELLQGRGAGLALGPYLLLEPLGEGGMGRVFKARHRALDRVVALKVIHEEYAHHPNAPARFEREAKAAARLSHPNVVAVYDAGADAGRRYLALEYVAGRDLRDLVDCLGALPGGLACECARQAALGLQHAHEAGLVHRDVKPSNLLLDARTGTLKLLDLGLASFGPPECPNTPRLTPRQSLLGTLDYAAPEQAEDARSVDIRADLYSLGCTLYFLLTGRKPFAGRTTREKLLKKLAPEAPAVAEVGPGVAEGVAAVLRKLMARRPQDRHQTPAEAAGALAAWCDPRAGLATWAKGAEAVETHRPRPAGARPNAAACPPTEPLAPAPVAVEGSATRVGVPSPTQAKVVPA